MQCCSDAVMRRFCRATTRRPPRPPQSTGAAWPGGACQPHWGRCVAAGACLLHPQGRGVRRGWQVLAGGGDGVAVEGARLPAGQAAGPRGLQDGLRQDGLIAMGHQLILLIILHN